MLRNFPLNSSTSNAKKLRVILGWTLICGIWVLAPLKLRAETEAEEKKRVTLDQMDIRGTVDEKDEEPNPEGEQLDKAQREYQKKSKNFDINGKKYNKLTGTVEKMRENRDEYKDNKKGYEEIVDRYNKEEECEKDPKQKDCEKYLSRRSRAKEAVQSTATGNDWTEAYSQQVYRILGDQSQSFKSCYQEYLDKTNGVAKGTENVVLKIKINNVGRVEQGPSVENDNLSSSIKECIRNVVRRLDFPVPMTKSVEIQQSLVLRPNTERT